MIRLWKRVLALVNNAVAVAIRPFDRFAEESADASGGIVPRAKYGVGRTRTVLAPLWRRSVRAWMVLTGFGVYLGLQLTIALLVENLWWWFIVAFFIVAGSLALAAARPTLAFLVWVFSSPLGFIFLRLDFGKGLPAITYDRIVIVVLAALLIVRTLSRRESIRKLILAEWLTVAFTLYIAVSLFFWETAKLISFLGIIAAQFDHIGLAIILYFVTKASLTKRDHIVWVIVVLIGVGTYVAASGFYEHFTGNMWFSSFIPGEWGLATQDVGRGRATGPMLNPTPYGTLLGITAFAALHIAAWTKNKAAKLFYYLAVPFVVIACYFCYTRGGYITLGLMVLGMPFLARGNRKVYAMAGVTAILVGMVAVPILLTNPDFHKRMSNVGTIYNRIAITASTINIVKHHPWFGVGLGNIDEALEVYITNAGQLSGLYARSYFPNKRYLLPVQTSHNSLLTILAEEGVVGFGLYAGAIIAFVVTMWRIRSKLPDKGYLGKDFVSFVLLAVVGHYVSIATYDVRFFKYPTYVLWILLALVIRLNELGSEKQLNEDTSRRPHLNHGEGTDQFAFPQFNGAMKHD